MNESNENENENDENEKKWYVEVIYPIEYYDKNTQPALVEETPFRGYYKYRAGEGKIFQKPLITSVFALLKWRP